jgi:hypothetical protein
MPQSNTQNQPLIIVDSPRPVSEDIKEVISYFGKTPVAWGRYFTTSYPVEYSHVLENDTLHKNNIKLLPIARHTNHVGGSRAQGIADAKQGVNDLFSTFSVDQWKSQGNEFLYFLDVEGNPTGVNGSISKEYYQGWSETLLVYSKERSENTVTILPCVYINYHDETTISILKESDVACYGLWIARYHFTPQKLPAWDETFAVPKSVQESSIPVFLRQYASGSQMKVPFDLDQTNPNREDIQKNFLDKLLLPPLNA